MCSELINDSYQLLLLVDYQQLQQCVRSYEQNQPQCSWHSQERFQRIHHHLQSEEKKIDLVLLLTISDSERPNRNFLNFVKVSHEMLQQIHDVMLHEVHFYAVENAICFCCK